MFRKWIALLLWAISFSGAAQNIDLLILNKNYNQALSLIEKGLDVHPEAEMYWKQAYVNRQLSRTLSAARSIENAIALDSANIKYLAEYADLQTELGNHYKALLFYRKAVDHSINDLNLRFKLGKAYINVENYQKAFEVFSAIQTKDSTTQIGPCIFSQIIRLFYTAKPMLYMP